MTRRFSRSALVALLVGALSVVVACSDDDGSTENAAPDAAEFCATALGLDEEVPASYVGSEQHVDDLRDLRALAPAELGDDLDLIIEHFDEDVDPSDPESQLIWNFPDSVNDAVGRVTTNIEQNCSEDGPVDGG